MADIAGEKFAQVLGALKSLESEYASTDSDSEKKGIQERMRKAIAELPEEHLTLFLLYAKGQVSAAEFELRERRDILARLEAEVEKRRKR
jgi:hypothetical protein